MGKYKLANMLMSCVFIPPHHRENFINYIKNPYSKWEDDAKVIFVHVPKAAGKAISYSLLGAPNGTGHAKLRIYERSSMKYNLYFKFTFVRNPWDRLVSAFFYMKNFDEGSNDRDFFDRYVGQDVSFEEFVIRLKNKDFRSRCLRWEHFTPQCEFLKNSRGEIQLDFIGRVENISEDFIKLCQELKFDGTLSERNVGDRKGYRDYYTEEMIEIVGDMYSEDIHRFGYEY